MYFGTFLEAIGLDSGNPCVKRGNYLGAYAQVGNI